MEPEPGLPSLLLLSALSVLSCTRSDASDAGTPADPAGPGAAGVEDAGGDTAGPAGRLPGSAPDTTFTLSGDRPKGGEAGGSAGPVNPGPPEPDRPWRQLLPRRSGEPVLPADFEIGDLADPFAAERDRREIAALVADFLEAYGNGTVKEEAIAPDRRTLVTRSLRYPLLEKAVPQEFRVGVPEIEGESGSSRVRLFGPSSRVDGTVYLVRERDRWLITDLQIDFLALLEPSEPRSEPFRPEEFASDIPF